jgi:hypothetical protein
MTKSTIMTASLFSLALAGQVAAQGISLDQLNILQGQNSTSYGLRLDGLAEITLGDSTIIFSGARDPFLTANILDDRAGPENDILHLQLGREGDHAGGDGIQLSELTRLFGDGADDDGLSLGNLLELRVLSENLITSDNGDPVIAANILDTDNTNGLTIADLAISTSRDNGQDDLTTNLARSVDNLLGDVSRDTRNPARGLLRLDGLAEVSIGSSTIISSGNRQPLVAANVLDTSRNDRTGLARVNLSSDRDNSESSTSGDRGLGGSLNRLTSGLLR